MSDLIRSIENASGRTDIAANGLQVPPDYTAMLRPADLRSIRTVTRNSLRPLEIFAGSAHLHLPTFLTIHPSVPGDLREFVAYASRIQGSFLASADARSTTTTALKSLAGIECARPYKEWTAGRP